MVPYVLTGPHSWVILGTCTMRQVLKYKITKRKVSHDSGWWTFSSPARLSHVDRRMDDLLTKGLFISHGKKIQQFFSVFFYFLVK